MDAQWFIQVSFWNWYDGFQGKEDGQQFIQHRFFEMNNLLVVRVMCKSNIDSRHFKNLAIDRISFQLLQYVYRISSQLLQYVYCLTIWSKIWKLFFRVFYFYRKDPLILVYNDGGTKHPRHFSFFFWLFQWYHFQWYHRMSDINI